MCRTNHLGDAILDFQREQYLHRRKSDGIYITNLTRPREKPLLAACAIAATENRSHRGHVVQEHWPASCADICCCHRSHSCCWPLPPGTFANQIQARQLLGTKTSGGY
ncbi:40S ribosomal protein SA [Galemys pyrenaicus]|uniref:40S ribosomal protein SA n=1 Tax=Galemys pyrenaicus TaxID=202257 RepID=A0A8J6A9G6_GALPY|nr:40S ribosomal protein SA [Galemys pyrenaicus]